MQRQQPFTPDQFRALYSQVTRLTVEVLVVDPQWGVLLTQRQEPSWFGLWHIPGGTVLFKEPVETALLRVALEELGVAVTPKELVGYIEYPSEEQERGFGYSVGMVFTCEAREVLETSEKRRFFTELPDDLLGEQRQLLEKVLSSMEKTLRVKG